MLRNLLACVVLLFGLLSRAPRLCAQSIGAAPPPAAREAFEAGRDAYERGRFNEALVYYEQAYQLSPSPGLLFNIARAADSDGQSDRARAAYAAYLEAAPNAENHEFVRARLQKLNVAPEREESSAQFAQPRTPALAPGPRVEAASADDVKAANSRPSSSAPDERTSGARTYWKSTWFWAAIGVVVAAGATAGIVVATRDDPVRTAADLRVKTLVQP